MDAALLFDELGPRGRIMIAVGSVFRGSRNRGAAGRGPLPADSWAGADYPGVAHSGTFVVTVLMRPATLAPRCCGCPYLLLGIVLGWLRMLDNRTGGWWASMDRRYASGTDAAARLLFPAGRSSVVVSDFWKLAPSHRHVHLATIGGGLPPGGALDRARRKASRSGDESASDDASHPGAAGPASHAPNPITQMVTIIMTTTLAYVLAYPTMYRGPR